jgi:hypothetical protein
MSELYAKLLRLRKLPVFRNAVVSAYTTGMRLAVLLSLLFLLPIVGCEDEDFVPKALADAEPEQNDAQVGDAASSKDADPADSASTVMDAAQDAPPMPPVDGGRD